MWREESEAAAFLSGAARSVETASLRKVTRPTLLWWGSAVFCLMATLLTELLVAQTWMVLPPPVLGAAWPHVRELHTTPLSPWALLANPISV